MLLKIWVAGLPMPACVAGSGEQIVIPNFLAVDTAERTARTTAQESARSVAEQAARVSEGISQRNVAGLEVNREELLEAD